MLWLLKGKGMRVKRILELFGISKSSFYYLPKRIEDLGLIQRIRRHALENPAYGYRRIWVLLRREGYRVNLKRVYRIYRMLDLKRPTKRKEKRVKAGEVLVLKATKKNHIWSMDFFYERDVNGRRVKVLFVMDEYTRRAFEPMVGYSIRGVEVVGHLRQLMARYGRPEYLRMDRGPEFRSKAMEFYLREVRVKALWCGPGKPYENGYMESLIGKYREENYRVYENLREVEEGVKAWIDSYNRERPHSALGYYVPQVIWEET